MMTSNRRYELDWLRVLAFFLLIFFHAGMPYVTHNWHINNADTSAGMSYLWSFFHSWRMPLLFMISGAGVWFALGSRSGGQFFKERCKRLLLPLTFGVLVIVPPQVYLERLSEGANFTSYIDFYPHFFDGHIFAGGNFTPNHLWFIYALFLYCMVALPIFLFLRSNRGAAVSEKLANVLSRPGGIYLVLLPIYLSVVWLKPYGKEYIFEFDHLLLVITGFVVISHQRIFDSIEQQRFRSLVLAMVGITCALWISYGGLEAPRWLHYLAETLGYGSLLLAIFGFGRRHLNFSNAFLRYTNEAVYPFYILHQTITVILAYHIVQWDMNLWGKFLLTSGGTAILTLAIYHMAIRPFNLIRPLFGLKSTGTNNYGPFLEIGTRKWFPTPKV